MILILIFIFVIMMTATAALADPVILTGKQLPTLVGKPIGDLRVTALDGKAIPFQADEVTESGEYVLPLGEKPNANLGNGVFDDRDELAFIWDDADVMPSEPPVVPSGGALVSLTRGNERRAVIVRADGSVPLSPKRYIEYDHAAHRVTTPYYYAVFAPDRFHFTRAGVKDHGAGKFTDLTNELRVSIELRALFGLVPIRYNENDMVCFVRRYKAGPVRLIRRGDFHLNMGLGVKGSRAAVDQICYPQMVTVPVNVSVPVRFRTLFSSAYIELTPVVRNEGRAFRFSVPSVGFDIPLDGGKLDTLHQSIPEGKLFTLRSGNVGYGWLLSTTMNRDHLKGSGYVMRRPSSRNGIAECGFRLSVWDVPKGNYNINNRVFFSGGKKGDIERLAESIRRPIKVDVLK